MAKSKSDISLNDLKAMLPQEGSIAEQEAALRALTTLSQEDRNLLAAVQESPYRLTTLEQFREFPANTEYFILESRVNKLDTLGWRYLFEHTDIVFPDELLKAIDPVPFGKYAMQEEQGCFTSRGYLTLSGDEWQHDRPQEKQFLFPSLPQEERKKGPQPRNEPYPVHPKGRHPIVKDDSQRQAQGTPEKRGSCVHRVILSASFLNFPSLMEGTCFRSSSWLNCPCSSR